jgi:streptogramin lyase
MLLPILLAAAAVLTVDPPPPPAKACAPTTKEANEGPVLMEVEPVESVLEERDGRVPVALRLHAQMYFLCRQDERFDERLRLLRVSHGAKRPVRLAFRAFSGRIVGVEPGGGGGDLAVRLSLGERARHTLHVPGYADFLALEGDDAWVTNEGRVEKLRAGASAPIATVPVAQPCGGMAVDFGSLWVVDCRERALVRIDLSTTRVAAVIPTGVADPEGELSVATGAGSVWLLTDRTGVLSRIDPATNSVVARIAVQPFSFAAAFGFDSVWTAAAAGGTPEGGGSLQRIDPRTNTVTATIPVGPGPRFLAAGAGAVWTLHQGDGTVSRVDPERNTVAASVVAEASGPGGDIAVGAGRVWVRSTPSALSVIDPASNRVVAAYGPPCGSGAVRANERVVWVTAHDTRTVWVLEP